MMSQRRIDDWNAAEMSVLASQSGRAGHCKGQRAPCGKAV